MLSSGKRLAGSKALSFALVTLPALPSVGFATPRGTVLPGSGGAHAAAAPPAQVGFVFEANTTGDGDRVSAGAVCDADAGTDYTAMALTTLTFPPGQTCKTVAVQAEGDIVKEANETFFVNLSGAVDAAVADAQGLGTILNEH